MTLRHFFTILLFILFPILVNAQQSFIDSLRNDFQKASDDERRYVAARKIYNYYEENNQDSAFHYEELSLKIAQDNHHKIAEGFCLSSKGYQLTVMGRYADALQCFLQAFQIAEDIHNKKEETWDVSTLTFNGDKKLLLLSNVHAHFGFLMFRTGNVDQELFHLKEAGRIAKMIKYSPRVIAASMNLGRIYMTINKPDSGLYFEKEAESISIQSGYKKSLAFIDWMMGDI